MLHRPQGGGSSRYADFRVDVMDVVVDGLWRDVNAVGDLGGGESSRCEAQHLNLTIDEPAGVLVSESYSRLRLVRPDR